MGRTHIGQRTAAPHPATAHANVDVEVKVKVIAFGNDPIPDKASGADFAAVAFIAYLDIGEISIFCCLNAAAIIPGHVRYEQLP